LTQIARGADATIIAVSSAEGEGEYAAKLTPEWRSWIGPQSESESERLDAFKDIVYKAYKATDVLYKNDIDNPLVSEDQLRTPYSELMCISLAQLGIIEFDGPHWHNGKADKNYAAKAALVATSVRAFMSNHAYLEEPYPDLPRRVRKAARGSTSWIIDLPPIEATRAQIETFIARMRKLPPDRDVLDAIALATDMLEGR
jgi:hypothetical protein